MLTFVKRTLYQCDAKLKATVYSTLVWPTLKYATVVWDPYQQYLLNSIEMVQWRAARWVKQEHSTTTNFEWSLLSKYSRLTLFFKLLHQDPPVIRIPQHYLPSTLLHYIITCSTLTIYCILHPTIHIYNVFPKEFLPQNNYWLE